MDIASLLGIVGAVGMILAAMWTAVEKGMGAMMLVVILVMASPASPPCPDSIVTEVWPKILE